MGDETIMASNADTGSRPSATLDAQAALLDTFFPGFSLLSTTIHRYLQVDLSVYVSYFLLFGLCIFVTQHSSKYLWAFIERHLISSADIRVDDEMYNMFMAWLTKQTFASNARRFVANTNVNSRNWLLLWDKRHDAEEEDEEIEIQASDSSIVLVTTSKKYRKMQYTPSFGTHYFWYRGRLVFLRRYRTSSQDGHVPISEREEISVACFGRNPAILKEILNECRNAFLQQDENKTLIYRGSIKSGSTEPKWIRSMSRVSRPFSTVVLDEDVKKALIADLKDYLHPHTRRWYSDRGIPYRRGYLLYGPPGTGKSSLSFAIAGYFKLKIYIVSLNSLLITEENLGTLFNQLPRRCVVLLEDIDTAGLTHTRENDNANNQNTPAVPVVVPPGNPLLPPPGGKLSLSALLNVIDGVASQEGRVLIMTTNHIDKLDEALIRPGRVDMMVKFNLATTEQLIAIFEGLFVTIEGDIPTPQPETVIGKNATEPASAVNKTNEILQLEKKKEQEVIAAATEKVRISGLAKEFATIVPKDTFSPAEIQGFLLKWKREPKKAVEMAPRWVEELRIKKEAAKAKAKGRDKKEDTAKKVDGEVTKEGANGDDA